MAKRKYADCFLKPEIIQAGDYQVFKMKGQDARSYDYTVRVLPISRETYPGDMPETAATDRVELYVGSKPMEIEKISGEVEVTLGKDAPYCVNKAAMVYIPKGMPVKHRIVRQPAETSWLLNFTLTPKKAKTPAKKGGK